MNGAGGRKTAFGSVVSLTVSQSILDGCAKEEGMLIVRRLKENKRAQKKERRDFSFM
jgi:hypothetical protein